MQRNVPYIGRTRVPKLNSYNEAHQAANLSGYKRYVKTGQTFGIVFDNQCQVASLCVLSASLSFKANMGVHKDHIFTKLTTLVPSEKCHHKPMGMYSSDLFKLALRQVPSEPHLFP